MLYVLNTELIAMSTKIHFDKVSETLTKLHFSYKNSLFSLLYSSLNLIVNK